MNRFLLILASILLLFNGIGAVYGGWNLIIHPDGSSIQLPMHWLKHTPFKNYFIPGIVLFTVNGLFSFFVFILLLLNNRYKGRLVMIEGILLTGWILVQVLLLQTIYFLHIILAVVGMGLIAVGILLHKQTGKALLKL
ncbi:MAG: hypothetical protein WBP16_01100 [Ferruginibacter sp.]